MRRRSTISNKTLDQVKKIKKGEMEAATAESVKEEDQKIVAEGKYLDLGAPDEEEQKED